MILRLMPGDAATAAAAAAAAAVALPLAPMKKAETDAIGDVFMATAKSRQTGRRMDVGDIRRSSELLCVMRMHKV
jgi:hypothetical protein